MAIPVLSGTPSNARITFFDTSLSYSHTTNGDPLLVFAASRVGVSLVRFNGIRLDLGGRYVLGTFELSWWTLQSPGSTTANVVVTNNSSQHLASSAFNVQNADFTAAPPIVATATGSSTAVSVAVPSSVDSLVLDFACSDIDGQTWAEGAGQTSIYEQNPSGGVGTAASTEAGASSVTMSWTLGTTDVWSVLGLSLDDPDIVATQRLSQVAAEVANSGSDQSQLSQMALEMATPTGTSPQRMSQFAAELGNTGTRTSEVSQFVIEIASPNSVPQVDLCAATEDPFIFVSIATPSLASKWYAICDLPDDATDYGGWKEDRLLDVSDVRRSLSGPGLDYQIGTFSVNLADDDYAIRSIIGADPGKFYSKWEIEAYLNTPTARNNGFGALKIATGLVDSDPEYDTYGKAMNVRLSCRDRIGIAMGWTNTGQARLPRRVLNQTTLPGVVSSASGKGAWLPWGILSNTLVIPSGFSAPIPSGISARGSQYVPDPGSTLDWISGWAPWDQTIAPVTNLILSTPSGGDCPSRAYAIQVFPYTDSGRVGDPNPYILGTVTTTPSGSQKVRADWTASPDADGYYVVLAAQWFGWRAQQIIITTGTSAEFNHAKDTPNPGTGMATGAVEPSSGQFYYYTARSKVGSIVSDWGAAAFPAQIFGHSFGLPNGKLRPLRLYFIPNGSPEYQIRKLAAGPFDPLLFTFPESQLEEGLVYWDEDFNNSDAITGIPNEDRTAGRVKGLYTRDVVLPDGDPAREILIAGTPIKDVTGGYYDPGGDPTLIEPIDGTDTEIIIPTPGGVWETVVGPNRYVDVLGIDNINRRYTFAYARGVKGDLIASGQSIVSFNVEGIENIGDCTGTVITDLHDQTVHELRHFVLASGEGYTAGLWPAPPVQGLDEEEIIDVASFNAVKAMREDEIAGGLVAAGITGFDGELIDVSDWLKRRCVSGDFRMGPSRSWQIKAAAINHNLSALFISNKLTDVYDIHNRTFRPQPRLAEMQNVFAYRYGRDTVLNSWLVNDQSYRNEESIAAWNLTKGGEDVNFHYLEDPAVVQHVLNLHTRRRANAPMYVPFEGGLCQLNAEYDIGEYFKIDHWRGIANQGWTDRVMWVVGHTYLSASKRVRLDCLDVTDLIGSETTNAILEGLMDIQLGGSWHQPVTVVGDPETVNAYDYWDMRFPWSVFPTDGTTLTAHLYGMVPSGASMVMDLYDPENLTVIATDPTPITATDFVLHSFQLPSSTVDKIYRLRATVTGGSGISVPGSGIEVYFKGLLRPNLPGQS